MQNKKLFHLTCAMIAMLCTLSAKGEVSVNSKVSTEAAETKRILVLPKAGLPEKEFAKLLKSHGATSRKLGTMGVHTVDLPPSASARSTVAMLASHPHIKFAEVDRVLAPNLSSNDPYMGSEWHLAKIGAPIAWDVAQGAGVVIAILDSGVDATHPDLAASMVPGWNVYDNNSATSDVYGHGTKVAGAAAAALNNGIGVAGVAGASKIMPIRISDTSGSATLSAMAQGLTWAADHGARVANISYVAADSPTVISAANYFRSKGGLVVTSAGNYAADAMISPTTSMLAVSATDANDSLASWSSFGSFVGLAAPGVGIYTTTNGGGYSAVSGTSFSSPITAGVIALMMSARPALSNTQIENALYRTATDLGTPGRDVYFGYGRVDAAAALQAIAAATPVSDTQMPTAKISAPFDAASVSGIVSVSVNATDNVGVTRVDLRVNGSVVASDSNAPFEFAWDSSTAPNGMASLTAVAVDQAGNSAISAPVAVNVANIATAARDVTPPSISIMNPTAGTVISGMVGISTSASDSSGSASLSQSLLIDGVTVATTTGGALNYKWNTRRISAGKHVIQAIARDASGNTSSQSVQVVK